MFELPTGGQQVLEVIFIPSQAEFFEQHFLLLCDNCQTTRFSVQGMFIERLGSTFNVLCSVLALVLVLVLVR